MRRSATTISLTLKEKHARKQTGKNLDCAIQQQYKYKEFNLGELKTFSKLLINGHILHKLKIKHVVMLNFTKFICIFVVKKNFWMYIAQYKGLSSVDTFCALNLFVC